MEHKKKENKREQVQNLLLNRNINKVIIVLGNINKIFIIIFCLFLGWTKPNAFHICITSYKLVIQDHQSFRRKKWKYLILDEAQNIKNFKSQRWQLLLNFQTQR